jgi:hypothetical protein
MGRTARSASPLSMGNLASFKSRINDGHWFRADRIVTAPLSVAR